MSSKRSKNHSNSDSDSEEERKRKYIKKRAEVCNHFNVKDECKTKKFVHLADSSAGVSKATGSLHADMDESKDKLVQVDQDPGEDETLGDDKKYSFDEANTAESKHTTVEKTQGLLSTAPSKKDLTQCTKAHQVRRVRTKSENDQLIDWIQNHENKKVKASLKDSSLRHSVDDSGRTLLHISAECGNVTATNYAMDLVDVNARDSNGRTALMLAIEHNHVNVVKILLPLSDIDVLDNEGKDVLHLSFAKKDPSKEIAVLMPCELRRRYENSEVVAEKLVDSGCQLYHAVFTKDAALLKSMVARGANVDAADPETKFTALHSSVVLEQPEIVKVLLEAGANVDPLDNHGLSPLVINTFLSASWNRNKLAILDLLLAHEVPLTTIDGNGSLPVSGTLSHGCAEAIARVLRAGYLDFGAVDATNGWCPMHYLASNCNRGVARQLKLYAGQYDYHVNATDECGFVPLHLAVKKGNVEMVWFLLEHGADANHAVTEKNTHGITPIYIPFSPNQIPFERECLEALLQHKADPQAILTDSDGKVIGTLFDFEQRSIRLRPIVAQLALIERQREPIAELILDKIHSRDEIREYFERCQALINKKLFGSITIVKLLSDSEKEVMGYLSNGKLRLKLKRLSQKLGIDDSFSYYFNILRKRMVKLLRLKELRDKAAGIVCKWFENPLDEKHIVIERILDFLDVSSLEQLISL